MRLSNSSLACTRAVLHDHKRAGDDDWHDWHILFIHLHGYRHAKADVFDDGGSVAAGVEPFADGRNHGDSDEAGNLYGDGDRDEYDCSDATQNFTITVLSANYSAWVT